ncbi:MAG: dihydroxyacetone kinase subunit DhaL [Brevefilum sp.]|nr:dihydroxyacetone kinase subunit DhaL [Brevefilum sp.]
MAVTKKDVLEWIKAFAQVIAENKEYLTELDAQIGDADHGANMDRGFRAVLEKLPNGEDVDIGKIMKTVGMTLLSKVGGAGGPLYSTIFMQTGMSIDGKDSFDLADWAKALEAATAGVVRLGKASPGDKTMVDALTPAVQALKDATEQGLSLGEGLKKSAEAAEEGMIATIPLVARKGRASYLGERSAGHQDPGATSTFMLLDTAAKVWANCS